MALIVEDDRSAPAAAPDFFASVFAPVSQLAAELRGAKAELQSVDEYLAGAPRALEHTMMVRTASAAGGDWTVLTWPRSC